MNKGIMFSMAVGVMIALQGIVNVPPREKGILFSEIKILGLGMGE